MALKKTRQCVKRARPAWWTQEEVLKRLQSGEFILAICQRAVDELANISVTISVASLRAEVAKWAQSASWGEQLTAALTLWRRTSSGEMSLSKHWHDDFIAAMDYCEGNAERAATMAGIGYGIVLAVLDKRNKCYDAGFAERFRISEYNRVGRMRAKYMDMAENGEGKLAVRAQERIIETALPALHGQQQEVHVSGNVKHEHEHQHTHTLSPRVVQASQSRVRRLSTGRQGLLPADDTADADIDGIDGGDESRVIDVTPQRQEVTA